MPINFIHSLEDQNKKINLNIRINSFKFQYKNNFKIVKNQY